MSDPIRLLDDPSLRGSLSNGGDARSLLELGRAMAPPSGARAQVWSGLEAVIAASAVGATAGAANAASAAPADLPSPGDVGARGGQANATVAAPAGKTSVALGTKLG